MSHKSFDELLHQNQDAWVYTCGGVGLVGGFTFGLALNDTDLGNAINLTAFKTLAGLTTLSAGATGVSMAAEKVTKEEFDATKKLGNATKIVGALTAVSLLTTTGAAGAVVGAGVGAGVGYVLNYGIATAGYMLQNDGVGAGDKLAEIGSSLKTDVKEAFSRLPAKLSAISKLSHAKAAAF